MASAMLIQICLADSVTVTKSDLVDVVDPALLSKQLGKQFVTYDVWLVLLCAFVFHYRSVVDDVSYRNVIYIPSPRADPGVVRMDPLRFLAGCRTRRLNQV